MAFDSGEATSLAGVGLSAATGNWLGAAIGAVGLGMQIFGGAGQAENAQKAAAVSQDEAAQEQKINDTKQQQMELEGRRSNIETSRNVQRARAMSLSASVNQGSNLGSGLQGGLAGETDTGLFHMAGVNAALSFGRQINSYNQNISSDKMQMASIQGSSATDAGIASLGGALLKAGPVIGQFSQGFGGPAQTMTNPYNSMPKAGVNF